MMKSAFYGLASTLLVMSCQPAGQDSGSSVKDFSALGGQSYAFIHNTASLPDDSIAGGYSSLFGTGKLGDFSGRVFTSSTETTLVQNVSNNAIQPNSTVVFACRGNISCQSLATKVFQGSAPNIVRFYLFNQSTDGVPLRSSSLAADYAELLLPASNTSTNLESLIHTSLNQVLSSTSNQIGQTGAQGQVSYAANTTVGEWAQLLAASVTGMQQFVSPNVARETVRSGADLQLLGSGNQATAVQTVGSASGASMRDIATPDCHPCAEAALSYIVGQLGVGTATPSPCQVTTVVAFRAYKYDPAFLQEKAQAEAAGQSIVGREESFWRQKPYPATVYQELQPRVLQDWRQKLTDVWNRQFAALNPTLTADQVVTALMEHTTAEPSEQILAQWQQKFGQILDGCPAFDVTNASGQAKAFSSLIKIEDAIQHMGASCVVGQALQRRNLQDTVNQVGIQLRQ